MLQNPLLYFAKRFFAKRFPGELANRLDKTVEIYKRVPPAGEKQAIGYEVQILIIFDEQFLDIPSFRKFENRLEGTHNRKGNHCAPRPTRNLIDIEKEPVRKQNDFHGHRRAVIPGNLTEHGQKHFCENAGFFYSPIGENRLARPHHLFLVCRQACHFQGHISLNRRVDVAQATIKKRPTAVFPLKVQ